MLNELSKQLLDSRAMSSFFLCRFMNIRQILIERSQIYQTVQESICLKKILCIYLRITHTMNSLKKTLRLVSFADVSFIGWSTNMHASKSHINRAQQWVTWTRLRIHADTRSSYVNHDRPQCLSARNFPWNWAGKLNARESTIRPLRMRARAQSAFPTMRSSRFSTVHAAHIYGRLVV